MEVPLSAFKAARLFSPSKINKMSPDFTAVDSLSVFPFMDSQPLGNLKVALPQYIAAAADVNPNYEALEFWKMHETSCQHGLRQLKRLLFSHHLLHANVFIHSSTTL